ncbi:DUF3892 domain-containing protein [Pedococcus sp. 5OH_020]|uniref:DUF3892 domain-containing protein n=1 Tax=Pedococcus sp. 5OH_020 TaxID=2989814 RepID=UPI003FA76D02
MSPRWSRGWTSRDYIGSRPGRSAVIVVPQRYGQPYLRTFADGQWNNNLLSLPRLSRRDVCRRR